MVKSKSAFLAEACLPSIYLVMLSSDAGGTHPQNRWEAEQEKMTHGTGGITRTLLTSGMLLQQCQEILAEASTLCCQSETHMSIRRGSKSVFLSWTNILKL